MLSFIPILAAATPAFTRAWALYEEAFPEEERRDFAQQEDLLTNPAYQFLAIQLEEKQVGVLGLWQLPDCVFVEHFAVEPAARGEGIGKKTLELLVSGAAQPFILEVEPPHTQVAQRRIHFYERAGFQLNSFAYWQPPYSPGKPWVSLQLMSYPTKLTKPELIGITDQLHRLVYNQKGKPA